MKTIFLITIAFLSFSAINAQSHTQKPSVENASLYPTKAEFFKALVAKNNLDIDIKELQEDKNGATNNCNPIIIGSKKITIAYNKKKITKDIKNNTPKALGDLMP